MAYAFFVLINNTGAGGHRRRLVKNIGVPNSPPFLTGFGDITPGKIFEIT
jgi:hypothetical protein